MKWKTKRKLPSIVTAPYGLDSGKKAKDDPELARMLDAAEHGMDMYRDTLKQLADS